MYRPCWIVKRSIIQTLKVDPKKILSSWENPYVQENLIREGFKKGEEFFVAYKTFTDDLVFIGNEREASRESSPNENPIK